MVKNELGSEQDLALGGNPRQSMRKSGHTRQPLLPILPSAQFKLQKMHFPLNWRRAGEGSQKYLLGEGLHLSSRAVPRARAALPVPARTQSAARTHRPGRQGAGEAAPGALEASRPWEAGGRLGGNIPLECFTGMGPVKTWVSAHGPTRDRATCLPWDSPLQLPVLLTPRNARPVGTKQVWLRANSQKNSRSSVLSSSHLCSREYLGKTVGFQPPMNSPDSCVCGSVAQPQDSSNPS
ncbi:uncharacterized protein LOC113994567 [Pipra filicauda]|uniref:Uncharacterized protein LOC113994567 n=1 Tax=Pipra filicauda TaxID=649802 RepID=A0A7R5KTQ4_9PASS|nr:uncharacterized protein LOC113994567 [Pipra filicauda]